MGNKRLKKCSTSTDVETDKGIEPLQIEVENLETDVKPKKKKQRKEKSDEIKQTDLEQQKQETHKKKKKKKKKKSKKQEKDLAEDSKYTKKKEEAPVTREELETYECTFETEDSGRNNVDTIIVRGFDESLARDEIKSALTEYFSSCGKVKRVHVPVECKTGASLGYAFIDVEDVYKALRLCLSYMGKFQLDVKMANPEHEYDYLPYRFKGCDRCGVILRQHKQSNFISEKEEEEEEEDAPAKSEEYECTFETEDSEGNNLETVFVRGFDESLARDEIKRALTEHFSSCGKVTRVDVPIECKTGASLGYAFIDVEDIDKAQRLDLSYMGEFQLDVTMAIRQREYDFLPSGFKGCDRCGVIHRQRKWSRFVANSGDRSLFTNNY